MSFISHNHWYWNEKGFQQFTKHVMNITFKMWKFSFSFKLLKRRNYYSFQILVQWYHMLFEGSVSSSCYFEMWSNSLHCGSHLYFIKIIIVYSQKLHYIKKIVLILKQWPNWWHKHSVLFHARTPTTSAHCAGAKTMCVNVGWIIAVEKKQIPQVLILPD